MHAATVAAAEWWAADRPDAATWIANYQQSLYARHRSLIAEIVGGLAPDSLIEIGCHCGPNLIRLAQDVPSLSELFGIDASAQAIKAGTEWATSAGLSGRVQMRVGRVPTETQGFENGSAAVVLSCYTLAYLGAADVDEALYEMGRLSSQAVILAEPMVLDGPVAPPTMSGLSGYTEWAHDYRRRLPWIGTLRDWRVRHVPVAPPVDRLNAILVLERPQ